MASVKKRIRGKKVKVNCQWKSPASYLPTPDDEGADDRLIKKSSASALKKLKKLKLKK